MSYLDTLFIDGTDIRSLTGLSVVGSISGLWAPATRRGSDDDIPARRGSLGSGLPLAEYVIDIPIRIRGASRGERNDNLRAVGAAIGGVSGNGLVALKRRVATGSGSSYAEHTANGRYITGLTMDVLNPYTGDASLQYYNLSGAWFDGSSWIYP